MTLLQGARRITAVVLLPLANHAAFAQTEYSADIVDIQKPGHPTLARLYDGRDERRLEMQSGDDSSLVVRLSPPSLVVWADS